MKKYLKTKSGVEFKMNEEGVLCVKKEIFPKHPTWYIAEIEDIEELIRILTPTKSDKRHI